MGTEVPVTDFTRVAVVVVASARKECRHVCHLAKGRLMDSLRLGVHGCDHSGVGIRVRVDGYIQPPRAPSCSMSAAIGSPPTSKTELTWNPAAF